MKKLLSRSSKVFFLLILYGTPLLAHSFSASLTSNTTTRNRINPDVPVTGKVTGPSGEPLPGVTIVLKNTTIGTTTSTDGTFQLTVPNGTGTLVASFIGFATKEIPVNGQNPVQVTLAEDTKALKEVVVVGYGSQERKNLVGSVSKVNPSETKDIPGGNFAAQLQGKASGVQISSSTGVPGEGIFIRVRGATSINASNDPLYVVDGVFVNNNSLQTVNTGGKATSPIADINPADIESIEVLKDANATAIYGSRGANGVVIVTTKRGSYNTKPKVTFNTSQGWAKAAKLWDLTTGPEHAALINEYWINSGIDNPALNQTFENRPFRPVSEGGRGLPEEQQTYDRLGDVFRTARLTNYDLSLQGGNANTRYYIGGGYTKQEAIIKPVYLQRANFKVNLDQQVSDKVQVGVSNTVSRTYRNQARAGDGPQGGLLQSALHTPTYLPKTNPDGSPARWAGFDNLDVLLNNYEVNSTSLRYIGNLFVDAEIIPGLKFRSSWGVDYNNYDESEYWNDKTQLGAAPTNGLATSGLTQKTSWLNEQTLTYRKNFGGKHTIGALVGNTLQSDVLNNTSAQGSNFASNSFTLISDAATRTSTQTWTKNSLASFFSRLDYNFDDKYLLEFTIRADGSSRFGGNNKWGYFPSIGGAWRLKEEEFLKNVTALSDLKLRGSFGVTGNQNGINDFAPLGLWAGGVSYVDNATSGDKPGIAPQQVANPNLKWERTRQVNAGVDVGLFDGRIGLEFNYYSKYTTDALLQLPVPARTGFATYITNAGEISNKGFELGINTVNVQAGDFTWNTNFNISRNINKIEKLPIPTVYGSRDLLRAQEGYPMYSFWAYKQSYVDPQTGNAVFEDVNKDGQITAADRQILGTASPKFFGGLTNNFTYKGFDAGVLISFQYGNKVWNHNRFFGEGGGTRDANRVIFASQLDRWQKPGDETDVPRLTGIGNNYRLEQNSRFLEDGSFLRLRSLTVGYSLPKNLLSRVKVENLRLYVVGTNLFLLTKYTGPDPESNVSNTDQNTQGLDLGTPPQPRTIQFGINITI
ncbi:TonB-dependent receptor [Adhaeribacter swui]|uniref:TonB-dependent receptor n=1 Tax=Adhaeribacter swui TaxID=2086471 RepID=A0A7G7G853_9BACT|nr:TonB-dependent receptor [Adhaeribacter swui]QNF33337.1 TonB-dependent receptor [Adhaeribacter swui]